MPPQDGRYWPGIRPGRRLLPEGIPVARRVVQSSSLDSTWGLTAPVAGAKGYAVRPAAWATQARSAA